MTNLTDDELDEMHEKVWIFPFGRFTLRAIAELRELRAKLELTRQIATKAYGDDELAVEWAGLGYETQSPAKEVYDMKAENDRLRAALEQLKDYFDLGEVVFEVSGRFVHAEKLINDTLANEKEMPHA